MSAIRHRLLFVPLLVSIGVVAMFGFSSAQSADTGAAPLKSSAATAPAASGKARVAKGEIVAHANSKFSAAELAKMRPHYNKLKPSIHSNTD
ncbi:MAG: hypothetical protein R3F24_04520 [Gammaproteobacteria bacterium]